MQRARHIARSASPPPAASAHWKQCIDVPAVHRRTVPARTARAAIHPTQPQVLSMKCLRTVSPDQMVAGH
eukprot:10764311-Alexandrium_andersonii.AAC.1